LPPPLLRPIKFRFVVLLEIWDGEFDELVVVDGRSVADVGEIAVEMLLLETIWRTFCTICSNSSHLNLNYLFLF
jgi:hypothetical protein